MNQDARQRESESAPTHGHALIPANGGYECTDCEHTFTREGQASLVDCEVLSTEFTPASELSAPEVECIGCSRAWESLEQWREEQQAHFLERYEAWKAGEADLEEEQLAAAYQRLYEQLEEHAEPDGFGILLSCVECVIERSREGECR